MVSKTITATQDGMVIVGLSPISPLLQPNSGVILITKVL